MCNLISAISYRESAIEHQFHGLMFPMQLLIAGSPTTQGISGWNKDKLSTMEHPDCDWKSCSPSEYSSQGNRLTGAYQYEGDPHYELLETLFNYPGVEGEFFPAMVADEVDQ
ncbi:hypothetical protein ACS0TY_034528 [Phlomoides rotata]